MWVKQFEYHGIDAFRKSYTSYSMQDKLDVLNYMNENGTSSNEAAVIFNISSPGIIKKWRIQLRTQEVVEYVIESKKKGRPSMTKKIKSQPKTRHQLKNQLRHYKLR
ncbi:hypothetical protein ACFU6E_13410 [Bacillus cereus]|uniref:hypothetical protein n=1 Tax=Bacillus cereus TaxID=1396 RepID=UPI00367065CD